MAAGAGSRMGRPKALVRDESGQSWLALATTTLLDAGCRPVLVALGAESLAARNLLPHDARLQVVDVADWSDGMAVSLSASLRAALQTDAAAAVITLVDLPGLPVAVIARVRAEIGSQRVCADTLRQASYHGEPGHPVVIGRQHWAPLIASLDGDSGARRYLLAHGVIAVECGDLWHGRDVDR